MHSFFHLICSYLCVDLPYLICFYAFCLLSNTRLVYLYSPIFSFCSSVCSGPCDSKPPSLSRCSKVIGAWAMGATSFSYPQEAGIPIGKTRGGQFLSVNYTATICNTTRKNFNKVMIMVLRRYVIFLLVY